MDTVGSCCDRPHRPGPARSPGSWRREGSAGQLCRAGPCKRPIVTSRWGTIYVGRLGHRSMAPWLYGSMADRSTCPSRTRQPWSEYLRWQGRTAPPTPGHVADSPSLQAATSGVVGSWRGVRRAPPVHTKGPLLLEVASRHWRAARTRDLGSPALHVPRPRLEAA